MAAASEGAGKRPIKGFKSETMTSVSWGREAQEGCGYGLVVGNWWFLAGQLVFKTCVMALFI